MDNFISCEKQNEFIFEWEYGFIIKVEKNNENVTIKANREGLISLAKIFSNLSQLEIPVNTHIHLDELNSLEENSSELIIEKVDNI